MKYIRSIDQFGDKPSTRLHFNGHAKYKTLCGGFCTLLMISILLLALVLRIMFPDYNIKQRTQAFGEKEEIFVKNAFQIMFFITDGIHEFELDRTKIDVYVKHTLNVFDEEGHKTQT